MTEKYFKRSDIEAFYHNYRMFQKESTTTTRANQKAQAYYELVFGLYAGGKQ